MFPHITDPEFKNVAGVLEDFFEHHLPVEKRPHPEGRNTHVDHLGYARYSTDYLTARAAGKDHQGAIDVMVASIKRSAGIVEPIAAHPSPLVGALRLQGGLFVDDTGPVLPMFCHFGEAFSAWCHGQRDAVVEQCRTIAAAGYHGIRPFTTLGYYQQAWASKEITPVSFTADNGRRVNVTPDYYGQKREFLLMLHGIGLRIMDDRGDLNDWTDAQKFEHMRENGRLYASLGDVGREVLAGLWAVNEAKWNGVHDPRVAGMMLEAFREGAGWWPDVRGLSDYDQSEMPASLLAWAVSPATVVTVHGNRVPNEHIIGHYLGYGFYDDDIRATGKRTWNTEPVGGGAGVSVGTVDDPELLCGIALEALMTGQAWTHMSGNGVFWNGPIEDHPGFHEVPRLLQWLPKDLHTFSTIGHAGTRFRGTRILAAIDDPPTRADYAIHADGRLVANIYGAGAHLPFERALSECKVIDVVGNQVVTDRPRAAGDRFTEPYRQFRLVVGRLA